MKIAVWKVRNPLLAGLLLLTSLFLSAQDNRGVPVVVSESGVGPINGGTPFDIGTIQKLLPSLRVISGVSSAEGIEFPTIRVLEGQTELFVAGPDENRRKVGGIAVTSARVAHQGKGKVGSLFSEIYGESIPKDCLMGAEEESGNVICLLSSGSHIRFLFKGASDRLDEGMPSIAALKVWRVEEMWWRP